MSAFQRRESGTNSAHPAFGMCTSPDTFRRHLNTRYFQQVFQPQIRLVRVHKLHLLTYLLMLSLPLDAVSVITAVLLLYHTKLNHTV